MNKQSPVPYRPDYSARTQPTGQTLIRAAFATALASGDPYMPSPVKVAKELWPDDTLLTRANVSPANTGTSAWAGLLSSGAPVKDFVYSLASQSAAARLIAAAGMNVSLDGSAIAFIPRRQGGAMGATDVAWIPQSGPIPVRKIPIDSVQIGPTCKLANITVMTGEIARSVNGEAAFSTLMREDFARSYDASMFSDFAGNTTQPKGLLKDVTPLTASSATDLTEAMLADMENEAAAIGEAGGSNVVYVMAPRQAASARLRLRNIGNTSTTIWPCTTLTAGTVVAVCPEGFVTAFGSEPRIETSNVATLHLEDTSPLAISTSSSLSYAAPVSSMFQQDLIAVKCVLDVAFCMRGDGLVQVITNVAWGGSAPT